MIRTGKMLSIVGVSHKTSYLEVNLNLYKGKIIWLFDNFSGAEYISDNFKVSDTYFHAILKPTPLKLSNNQLFQKFPYLIFIKKT
ncbi:MAG: hypothetical protein U5L45_20605 [Saprospiraceae bacterium]|nr:hypothetical protein [Saprospiraceae bacterium]